MRKELLEEILKENGIEFNELIIDKLVSLESILLEFNSHTNLTAITSETGIATLHFADCLIGKRLLEELNVSRETLLDVGAGGGFPSLPLSIAFPNLKVVALDSTEKKLRFVSEAAEKLGLDNITTLPGRAEEIIKKPGNRESFDYVTARAVSKLSIISELCLPFLKVGGYFIAYKGLGYEEEIKEAQSGIEKLGGKIEKTITHELYGDGEPKTRCLVLIKKVKASPDKYPRNYSMICKKPLV